MGAHEKRGKIRKRKPRPIHAFAAQHNRTFKVSTRDPQLTDHVILGLGCCAFREKRFGSVRAREKGGGGWEREREWKYSGSLPFSFLFFMLSENQ